MWPGFDALRGLNSLILYSALRVSPSHQKPTFDLICRDSVCFVVLPFNRWIKEQGTFYALLACFASLHVCLASVFFKYMYEVYSSTLELTLTKSSGAFESIALYLLTSRLMWIQVDSVKLFHFYPTALKLCRSVSSLSKPRVDFLGIWEAVTSHTVVNTSPTILRSQIIQKPVAKLNL